MANVIKVDGMSCEHCEHRVEKAVLAVAGVTSAKADAAAGTLTYEGGDAAAVAAAVEDAGYDVIG